MPLRFLTVCLTILAPLLVACTTLNPSDTASSQPSTAQRVFIIHGYGANPDSHWFPWLKQRVESHGAQATTVALPHSDAPDFAQWQAALYSAIGTPRPDDVFVAHSLGTISSLHYLSAQRPERIGGLVLVSGFAERLPALPRINDYDVDAYIDQAHIDIPTLRRSTPHIVHIVSDNDSIVAPAESLKLTRHLGGTVEHVPQGGHFLAEDGFTQLAPAWQAVEPLLKPAAKKKP